MISDRHLVYSTLDVYSVMALWMHCGFKQKLTSIGCGPDLGGWKVIDVCTRGSFLSRISRLQPLHFGIPPNLPSVTKYL
jgi:hypothetical protein